VNSLNKLADELKLVPDTSEKYNFVKYTYDCLSQAIKEIPNDTKLGAQVRKFVYSLEETYKL